VLETAAERGRARAETPLVVRAPAGDLVAIHTPADPQAPPAGRCVVHLTRPRSHRNRKWVRGARALAAGGFSACRFDYHGNGDSTGDNALLDPSHPYVDDLMAVLAALRAERGERRFILTGSCFDARTALAAFSREPGWIDGLAFISAPVMPLADMHAMRASRGSWNGVWQAVHNPDNWKRLADPALWRNVESRLRGATGRAEPAPDARAGPALDPGFVRDFEALVASPARALFLYGEDDQELLTFQPVVERLLPGLPPGARERIRVEIWPGEVHDGFNHLDRQREIVERVLEWVTSFHPAAAAGVPNVSASPA